MILPRRPESQRAWAGIEATLATQTTRLPPTTFAVGCLVWEGRAGSKGYGLIYLPRIIRVEGWPATASTHRVACFLAHGLPPEPNSLVRHRCNNPPCCEPTHLQWGTHHDNSNDAAVGGRLRASLTRWQVDEIREAYTTTTVTQSELARRYKVTPATIHQILTGQTWRWCLTNKQREALHIPASTFVDTYSPPTLTERLLKVIPPKPDGTADDDYVTRWVLDTAAAVGITTTAVVHMALKSSRTGGMPQYVPDDVDPATVLELAAAEQITTSEAAAIIARRDR